MYNSKKICLIATISALSVGLNYALVNVPNFKVMDLFVFVAGFIFGPLAGAFVGVLVWVIYGVINPYGFVFQVWLATMFSESIYGFIGGVLGKKMVLNDFNCNYFVSSVLFGVLGFFLTLVYDLVTNIVFALTFNVPIVIAILAGVPFALVHELSNAALFGTCSVPLISVLERFIGGDSFGVIKK